MNTEQTTDIEYNIKKHTKGEWLVNITKRYVGGRGFAITVDHRDKPGCKVIGRVRISIKDYVECVANADLIAEAGTVASETSLTPRQLYERVKHLEGYLHIKNAERAIKEAQDQRDELLKLVDKLILSGKAVSEFLLEQGTTNAYSNTCIKEAEEIVSKYSGKQD